MVSQYLCQQAFSFLLQRQYISPGFLQRPQAAGETPALPAKDVNPDFRLRPQGLGLVGAMGEDSFAANSYDARRGRPLPGSIQGTPEGMKAG